jgi:hypothetical protein
MRLTQKDKEFIETLRRLLDEKQLRVEFREDGAKRIVLRQNYGDGIEVVFGMTRQGVRWRFQRLFNELYVDAYLRIYWIESNFGADLRHYAMAIAKQQIELRQMAQKLGTPPFPRRGTGTNGSESAPPKK